MGCCLASDTARGTFVLAAQREARAVGHSPQNSGAPSVGRVPSGTAVRGDEQASDALRMSHKQEGLATS